MTRETLDLVERGEAIVRQFGFEVFRVRYISPEEGSFLPPGANVQISPREMHKLEKTRQHLIAALSASGFGSIRIDPEGYRSKS